MPMRSRIVIGHWKVTRTTPGRRLISMEPAMTDARTRNRLYPVRFRRSWGASFWQGSFGVPGV